LLKIHLIGKTDFEKAYMKGETKRAKYLAFLIAIIFGMISQNITMIIVIVTIETPTPTSPHLFILNEAAMLEAKTLENILPMRMVIRRLVGLSRRDSTIFEFLTLFIFRCLTLILFKLKRDVSEPEKNADRNKSIKSAIIWYDISTCFQYPFTGDVRG
jgi:radical SAM superfamily enzyme